MIEWLSNTFDLRFYYWTGLNWIILLPTYLIGAGLLGLLWWRLAKRMRRAWTVVAPLVAVLIIAPWVEELWIAWNFGRLCKKDAGIFIYKTVEVEGFYNATGATLDLVRPGGYQFIESHGDQGKGTIRLTFGNEELKRQAFAKYEKEFPGKNIAEQDMIRVDLDERTEALIFPKKGDSWRITILDHPTARYHYRWPDFNTRVGHKVYKQSEEVIDAAITEVLGGSIQYGRKSPWYFVALDDPGMSCPRPGEDPLKEPGLVYKRILKPVQEPSRGRDYVIGDRPRFLSDTMTRMGQMNYTSVSLCHAERPKRSGEHPTQQS